LAQPNHSERSYIPFLDRESQSNIIVKVSDVFGEGQPCPKEYTNVLSNTNLFSLEEQRSIKHAFLIYTNVTTNSGPPGTILANHYKTNYAIKVMGRIVKVTNWISRFQYTNCEAHEEIMIGKGGILAKFRNGSNDGYNVYIDRTGGGSILQFMEVKQDLISGVLADFEDTHEQGTTWDYRLANFNNSRLAEYRQYTNGMVFGHYFVWNARNGNLIIESEFKQPYDFENHRVQIP
jgi:hypothetical protein